MSSFYPETGTDGVARPSQAAAPDTGSDLVGAAREKLAEAGTVVRGEAAHFAEKAKEDVAQKVEETASAVTDALAVFADAIRKAGEELEGQDHSLAGKLASQAADGLQAFSRNLGGKSPEQMLHTVRDFGRENPTAYFAGAVLAGVALGRFARSSGHHDPSVSGAPETPASHVAGDAPREMTSEPAKAGASKMEETQPRPNWEV